MGICKNQKNFVIYSKAAVSRYLYSRRTRKACGFDKSCSIYFPDAHKKWSYGAAESKKVPPSCPHLFRKGKNQNKLKNYRETQDSRKPLEGRNDRSLMYGARHTQGSRHFCICEADLESWVHCVVHILILSGQIGGKEARESLRVRNPLSCRAAWQF